MSSRPTEMMQFLYEHQRYIFNPRESLPAVRQDFKRRAGRSRFAITATHSPAAGAYDPPALPSMVVTFEGGRHGPPDYPIAIVAALAIVIWLIALAFGALGFTLTGAAILGVVAAEQGFIGLAVYAATWVFMFPLMLVVSLVLGFVMSERSDDEQARLYEDREPSVLEMLAEQARERKRRVASARPVKRPSH